ncbi:hypothetical protein ACFXOI_12820 [Streptomyces bacillaris]|uniref:hypothetical protein n=1 Tax=Streptomyces bacillaris TaxID=68179 RepID=UPI0036A4D655
MSNRSPERKVFCVGHPVEPGKEEDCLTQEDLDAAIDERLRSAGFVTSTDVTREVERLTDPQEADAQTRITALIEAVKSSIATDQAKADASGQTWFGNNLSETSIAGVNLGDQNISEQVVYSSNQIFKWDPSLLTIDESGVKFAGVTVLRNPVTTFLEGTFLSSEERSSRREMRDENNWQRGSAAGDADGGRGETGRPNASTDSDDRRRDESGSAGEGRVQKIVRRVLVTIDPWRKEVDSKLGAHGRALKTLLQDRQRTAQRNRQALSREADRTDRRRGPLGAIPPSRTHRATATRMREQVREMRELERATNALIARLG